MTTDEKLQHFLDICMEDARDRSARLFDEYTNALQKNFEEHQTSARRQAKMQLDGETEKMQREMNKNLALGQIQLKRVASRHQEELKDKLFVEVKDQLENYMNSGAYFNQLEAQVKQAREFAGDEEMVIYMDPSDSDKVNRLALHHGVNIKVSDYSFGGGIRAVIPTRHILIDNSFDTKLAEAKRDFRFDTETGAPGSAAGNSGGTNRTGSSDTTKTGGSHHDR